MTETHFMISLRSFTSRSIIGIVLETLPWLGLAVGSTFLPSAALPSGPGLPLLLPLGILAVGGLSIVGRRWWNTSSRSSPSASPSGRAAPSVPRRQGDGVPSDGSPWVEATVTNAFTRPTDDVGDGARAPVPQSIRRQRENETPCRETERDGLTGLATRSSLLEKVTALLEQPDAGEETPALLSVTIDEYRDVTGSFGHEAGQHLLTAMATRIDEAIPPSATAARIAEDTFAVLLKQTNDEQARRAGRELLDAFEQPFQIAGHQVPIQPSVGLATRPAPDATFSSGKEMLQASYSAMHHVQRQGGGSINLYQNEEREQTRWLHRRERLREAIHDDELTLHYQPIVHLVSQEIVGAEALVRWEHPERGLLPPSAFLPLAEETGLVGEIDRWVFEEALKNASAWTRSPALSLDWISVNVSPQSVENDFQSWCREKLRSTPLPDGALHLEITEGWALRDERSLQPLRDDGVKLSIDDFGTGYSSLRYLRSLDADVLKIDREFIQDLGRDPKTTAIVQFLMNLSLRLDVEVIAEGVETEEQESTLHELGCAMAQGYYFSRPIPAETLIDRTLTSVEQTEPSGNDFLRSA